jgi:hypothetical protein
MRLRRIWRWWPAAVVLVVGFLIYAAWPGSSKFTVSPDTTHITGPFDEEGFLDYPTALNQRLSEGVTPEKNANVLLWQALGPKPEGGNGMPPDYFRWLGVAAPPEQGEYFIGSDKYFEKHLKGRPGPEAEEPITRFWLWPVEELDELNFTIEPDPRQEWSERISRGGRWPWKAADDADLMAWLQANEKPLAIVAEGVLRPTYYNPLVSSQKSARSPRLIGSLLPSVQKLREVCNALACRAMVRAGAGDYDGAWRDTLTIQRLGRLLGKGGTLIEHLVAVAITTMAANAQVKLLGLTAHPVERLRSWQADLRRLPPMPGLADKLDHTERLVCLDSMMSITLSWPQGMEALADGPVPGKPAPNPVTAKLFSRSVDWDPAFRNVNQMFDRCAAASRLTDPAARRQAYAQIEAEIKGKKAGLAGTGPLDKALLGKAKRGEMIGDILIGLLFPSLEKIQSAADRIEQTLANLDLALGLAVYRAETGHYPARLDDLAPKHVATVAVDVFSGKPLIYKASESGYTLYSVGANGVDDGGQSFDDEPRGDDLRVRIPLTRPEPKSKPAAAAPPLAPRAAID